MKNFNTLALAAVVVCGVIASGCEKQSDSIVPVQTASKTADSTPAEDAGFPMSLYGFTGVAPCALGGTWLHGTAATGLSNWLNLRLKKAQLTGVGEIDVYESDDDSMSGLSDYTGVYSPAPAQRYDNTVYYNGNGWHQEVRTVVMPDGSAKMTVTINLNKNKNKN